jgi:hypothetical protein
VSGAVRHRCRGLLPLLVGGALSACTGPNPWFMQRGLGSDAGGLLDGRAPAGGSAGGGVGGVSGTGGSGASAGGSGGAGTGGSGGGGSGGATGGATGGSGGVGGVGTGGAGGTSSTGGSGGTGGATAGAGGTTGGTGGTTGGTGGTGGSGGSAVDAGSEVGSPPAVCGSNTGSVTTISGARGIAIDRDGTIYFTRETPTMGAFIGRIRPGQPPEASWFPVRTLAGQIIAGATPRMLRTQTNRFVVVADPGVQNGVVYTLLLASDAPQIIQSVPGITGIHGLAVAADGAVFASRSDGHVDRWMPDNYRTIHAPVTTAPVFPGGQRVLGMAFGLDGLLYMGSNGGGIKRARVVQTGPGLTDFRLMDITNYGSFTGTANDLAVDVDGRIYVSDHTGNTNTRLAIVPPGGVGTVMRVDALMGRLSGLAWGRGTLACSDLYVTDLGGVTRRWGAGHLALDLP